MRRKERQVTNPAEIRAVIDRCKVLRLGLNAAGAPYIVPMNFGWEMTDGLPCFTCIARMKAAKSTFCAPIPA